MQFELMNVLSASALARPFQLIALLLSACVFSGCAMAWVGADTEFEPSASPAQKSASPSETADSPLALASEPGDELPANDQTAQAIEEAPQPNDAPTASATVYDISRQTETEIQDPQPATHTVKPGDTLTRIADRYEVSINALLGANDLPNPDYLAVGQVINLPQAPVEYTASFRILPDSRLVRSIGAYRFNVEDYLSSQPGILPRMTLLIPTRLADGRPREDQLSGSQIVERVSREYSVDARLLLAFLEHFARLITDSEADEQAQLYPLLAPTPSSGILRGGLYNQLSWLADQLNKGYYDWKYRGQTIHESADGSRRFYHPDLNAASIALQFVIAQMRDVAQWEIDVSETGIYSTYRRLFGDPSPDSRQTTPANLAQPELTLPFPRGDAWRFTGGFHGGWGNGSAWAAVDFAPPDEAAGWCYTSAFPVIAVARGLVVRLGDGLIVLDLDQDGDEGSGWTILYLHVSPHDSLREGEAVDAGNILGYASCAGGFSTATHLHIARRYNGEWIPAHCNRCPPGVAVPPFVMSNWEVVGLGNQLYQGFLVNTLDNRSVIAEQGRFTDVNAISW